jgi:hypothetical protein
MKSSGDIGSLWRLLLAASERAEEADAVCVIRVLKSLAVGIEERREWEYLDTMAELAKAMVDEVRERGSAELAERELALDPDWLRRLLEED